MAAQIINFPAAQASQSSEVQTKLSDFVTRRDLFIAFMFAAIVMFPIGSYNYYGIPALFIALGVEVLAFCAYAVELHRNLTRDLH